MSNSLTKQVVHGQVILQRLAASHPPGSLKPFIKDFGAEQEALGVAVGAVADAKRDYDAALGAVASADRSLDATVLSLADTLVGAGVSERLHPFASFVGVSPSTIVNEPYAVEVTHVRELVAAIANRPTTGEVAKATVACTRAATVVEGALAGLTLPKQSYAEALRKRDERAPSWKDSLARLKTQARAVFLDGGVDVGLLFAPPDAVQAPVRRRTKAGGGKAGAGGTATNPSSPGAEGGSSAAPPVNAPVTDLPGASSTALVSKGQG